MDGKTNRESNLAVSVYKRRRPEESVLHQIIRENWLTFRDTTEQSGRSLPVYVQKEFERLVDCGVLARGFARVHCPGCGYDRLVAFACKSRSLCSSCVGRHMNETSAYLVDDVIGEDVSVRHWVCTLPPPLRYLLAYDNSLCTEVLGIFVRTVFGWLKRKAKTELGSASIAHAHPASVTAIHRASSHLALNDRTQCQA